MDGAWVARSERQAMGVVFTPLHHTDCNAALLKLSPRHGNSKWQRIMEIPGREVAPDTPFEDSGTCHPGRKTREILVT